MTNTNTSVDCIARKDKRVWPKYNSSLVNRIEVLMDTSFLNSWDGSLERENDGKVGHPFEYPEEFFVFLAKIRSLWNVPFRELDGFVRKLSKLTGKFKPLSYVAIFNRIRDIPIMGMLEEINSEATDGITVIIDSSGLKITERGDWLTTKWKGKRRGWIKIHIAIDADAMNVVSLTITDEHRSDTKEFRNVLNPIIGKASEVQGDKGYDSKSNFNYLLKNDVKAAILPRENARTLSRGSPARAKVVRAIRKMGLNSWKSSVQYGKRWRVEIFFSALKRTVGEVIRAKKLKYQVQEAIMKIYCYFLLRKNTVVN
jgi:IS5 family transposase